MLHIHVGLEDSLRRGTVLWAAALALKTQQLFHCVPLSRYQNCSKGDSEGWAKDSTQKKNLPKVSLEHGQAAATLPTPQISHVRRDIHVSPTALSKIWHATTFPRPSKIPNHLHSPTHFSKVPYTPQHPARG
jgi:hypothetical protein